MTPDDRRTAFHPQPGQVQLAALEAMRDLSAPVGSRWQHRATHEVWQLVERTGSTVLLQMPGTRRHKSGLLHVLLRNYLKVPAL